MKKLIVLICFPLFSLAQGIGSGVNQSTTTLPKDAEKICYELAGDTLSGWKIWELSGKNPVFRIYDNNGVHQPLADEVICSNDCLSPIGYCRCYVDNGESANYIDTDLDFEGSFSIGGGSGNPDMKWNVDPPPNGGLGDFTLRIIDCINSGNVAVITITGSNGVVYEYNATGIETIGSPDGSGNWYFTGPGSIDSGDSEISAASLTCGGSIEREICAFLKCESAQIIYLDILSGDTVSQEELGSMMPCSKDTIQLPKYITSRVSTCINDEPFWIIDYSDFTRDVVADDTGADNWCVCVEEVSCFEAFTCHPDEQVGGACAPYEFNELVMNSSTYTFAISEPTEAAFEVAVETALNALGIGAFDINPNNFDPLCGGFDGSWKLIYSGTDTPISFEIQESCNGAPLTSSFNPITCP